MMSTRLFAPRVWAGMLAVAALLLVVVPVLHLWVPPSSPLHVSAFWVKIGRAHV